MTDPTDSSHPPRIGLAGPFGPFLYALGWFLSAAVFRLIWRLRVIGATNVPREGGLILASNHASNGDPLLVGSSVRRRIYFMAKQELFNVPILGPLIKQVNAFPIRRMERDMGAFRMAQRILTSGRCLILFPEGTRQKDGNLGRARPGVGMMAIRTGCRVVPVYVHNSHRLPGLAKLAVVFGQPISPEGETDYQAFSDKVMAAIGRLKEEHFGAS